MKDIKKHIDLVKDTMRKVYEEGFQKGFDAGYEEGYNQGFGNKDLITSPQYIEAVVDKVIEHKKRLQ